MSGFITENIEWHPIKMWFPVHMERVLIQTNDGIMIGFWDEHKQNWMVQWTGNGYSYLNKETYPLYVTYWPKGVAFQ